LKGSLPEFVGGVARPPRRYAEREAAVRSGGGSKVWRQKQRCVAAGARVFR
jgi:hypothetical protein